MHAVTPAGSLVGRDSEIALLTGLMRRYDFDTFGPKTKHEIENEIETELDLEHEHEDGS